MTPLQAIKAKCLECSNDSAHEVKLCEITDCSLYEYRFGKGKSRGKKDYTPEARKAIGERLRQARISSKS
jgi:hypothetical protein